MSGILGKSIFYSVLIIGGGYTLMRATAPSDQEIRTALEKSHIKYDSPEVNRQKNEALMAALKAASERDSKPIWLEDTRRR